MTTTNGTYPWWSKQINRKWDWQAKQKSAYRAIVNDLIEAIRYDQATIEVTRRRMIQGLISRNTYILHRDLCRGRIAVYRRDLVKSETILAGLNRYNNDEPPF